MINLTIQTQVEIKLRHTHIYLHCGLHKSPVENPFFSSSSFPLCSTDSTWQNPVWMPLFLSPVIQWFTQQSIIEHLFKARPWARCWGHSRRTDRHGPQAQRAPRCVGLAPFPTIMCSLLCTCRAAPHTPSTWISSGGPSSGYLPFGRGTEKPPVLPSRQSGGAEGVAGHPDDIHLSCSLVLGAHYSLIQIMLLKR